MNLFNKITQLRTLLCTYTYVLTDNCWLMFLWFSSGASFFPFMAASNSLTCFFLYREISLQNVRFLYILVTVSTQKDLYPKAARTPWPLQWVLNRPIFITDTRMHPPVEYWVSVAHGVTWYQFTASCDDNDGSLSGILQHTQTIELLFLVRIT